MQKPNPVALYTEAGSRHLVNTKKNYLTKIDVKTSIKKLKNVVRVQE